MHLPTPALLLLTALSTSALGVTSPWSTTRSLSHMARSVTEGSSHSHPKPHTFSNTTLYLPSIAVAPSTGFATPECWALTPNYTIGTDPSLLGTLDLPLGETQTASFVHFPEDFKAPLHGPGGINIAEQVIFLSGAAIISFPNATGTITCSIGTNLIVVDISTVSNGHYTDWKAGTSVVLVQFKDGVVPGHEVVDRSFCA
ncbi:hypothetical protein BCR35DRAFT_336437 [Leucosporidium creatinivorum]|uniref:Ubiquitin 3 binding protein But2 C-terminal domain-containing protein n=1 Tax=Leucosporidium creatinivorum TaxID=106004 RepID=A0A1Y2C4E2_9BASI|nr:hypothetical protein BCR35DRAFT_336437 [Leucosporidium creatinivorum]